MWQCQDNEEIVARAIYRSNIPIISVTLFILLFYAVMKLYNAVKDENWKPSVLVLNNTQLSQLLLDNRFIEYEYLPSKGTDLEAGLIREILGMKVKSSTLVPNGTAYAIDKDIVSIMRALQQKGMRRQM